MNTFKWSMTGGCHSSTDLPEQAELGATEAGLLPGLSSLFTQEQYIGMGLIFTQVLVSDSRPT